MRMRRWCGYSVDEQARSLTVRSCHVFVLYVPCHCLCVVVCLCVLVYLCVVDGQYASLLCARAHAKCCAQMWVSRPAPMCLCRTCHAIALLMPPDCLCVSGTRVFHATLTVWLLSSSMACLPSNNSPGDSLRANAARTRATPRGCTSESTGTCIALSAPRASADTRDSCRCV